MSASRHKQYFGSSHPCCTPLDEIDVLFLNNMSVSQLKRLEELASQIDTWAGSNFEDLLRVAYGTAHRWPISRDPQEIAAENDTLDSMRARRLRDQEK